MPNLICLLLGAAFCAGGEYGVEMVEGADPIAVKRVADGFGFATLETDKDGDPKIFGRINGKTYEVFFYDCVDRKACKAINLVAAWSLPTVTPRLINDYNRDHRFGRAYIDDEGDPVLEMDINLYRGVTARNLNDSFHIWRDVMAHFRSHLNEFQDRLSESDPPARISAPRPAVGLTGPTYPQRPD